MRRFLILAMASLVTVPANAQDSSSPHCRLKIGTAVAQARAGLCSFDLQARRFAGTPAEQARCLLREVRRGARIGDVVAPDRLVGRAGTTPTFTRGRLASYLTSRNIDPRTVGMATAQGFGAEYFIIHDTSTPNCSNRDWPSSWCPVLGAFPSSLNDSSWRVNQTFSGHKPPTTKQPLAHAWTNRVGESIVEVPFERHISHMKFDYCHNSGVKRGLFLGVENIQPRIGSPAVLPPGRKVNDLVAPMPGFSDPQYERLALLYAVASVRRGHWLIPAYHAVVDHYYVEGHDDPQNFDINRFDHVVATLVQQLEALR